jgi:hypothetical protein
MVSASGRVEELKFFRKGRSKPFLHEGFQLFDLARVLLAGIVYRLHCYSIRIASAIN